MMTDPPTSASQDFQTAEVLKFWFDVLGPDGWFVKDAALDARITESFLTTYEDLSLRQADLHATTAHETLAQILVLDQFPRNMFRDTPRAFATDAVALRLSKEAIASRLDRILSPTERQFLYMPFQHSEDLEDQAQSVRLYEGLGLEGAISFARRHKDVIDQFGRFPHRNEILGRVSTPAEQAYLSTPGSGF